MVTIEIKIKQSDKEGKKVHISHKVKNGKNVTDIEKTASIIMQNGIKATLGELRPTK